MRQARRTRSQGSYNKEQGAVIVELALALPLLVVLLLTIVDLGLVVREHQLLQNAAREGAHFSALPMNQLGPLNPNATENDIKQRVIEYCALENIVVMPENITVDQQHPIVVGGLTVIASEVTVAYSRQLLFAGAPFLSFGDVTLSGNAVFRNFY